MVVEMMMMRRRVGMEMKARGGVGVCGCEEG